LSFPTVFGRVLGCSPGRAKTGRRPKIKPNGKMSLFHKTEENAGPVTFTEKEAVVALLFLAVTSDGSIAPEEEELVIAASNRMKLLRDQGIPEFNATVQKVRDAIDGKGRAEVLAAGVKALPPDLRETVYTLAADIVFADGTAHPDEMIFLREAQEALEVPDDLATKVIEVMRIKNRG
jgi:tellurite resistance protein